MYFVKVVFQFSRCLLQVSNPNIHLLEDGCTYRYNYTIPVRTTVFLKMNTYVRYMQKTITQGRREQKTKKESPIPYNFQSYIILLYAPSTNKLRPPKTKNITRLCFDI